MLRSGIAVAVVQVGSSNSTPSLVGMALKRPKKKKEREREREICRPSDTDAKKKVRFYQHLKQVVAEFHRGSAD